MNNTQLKTKRPSIALSRAAIEHVQWAIEPMFDLWCTEDGGHFRDGPVYEKDDLPWLDELESLLVLSGIAEINSDLHYRIAIQLPDMAYQADGISVQKKSGLIRCCERIAAQLESVGVAPEQL